jgi:hypothetical protein
MKRGLRVALLLGAVFVLIGILMLKTVGAKAASSGENSAVNQLSVPACDKWTVMPSPHPNVSSGLSSVAMVSAQDGWAVGTAGSQSTSGVPLIEFWNGLRWRIVPSPTVQSRYSTLQGVSAISLTNAWAVGYWANSRDVTQTLIEHWNGVRWSVVPSPSPGSANNELFGVSAASANNIWAAGFTATPTFQHTLIEHWNGVRWSVVASPSPGPNSDYLSSVAAVSVNNVWAVGSRNTFSQTLTEHWNGAHWTVVPSPSLGSSDDLRDVSATAANNVWAVGYSLQGSTIRTLTERWNGTHWLIVASPNVGSSPTLTGVAAISTNDAWTVGSDTNHNQVIQPLIEQWNGTRWNVVASPSPAIASAQLSGVAAVSAKNVWAVGYADSNPLIEHYLCP